MRRYSSRTKRKPLKLLSPPPTKPSARVRRPKSKPFASKTKHPRKRQSKCPTIANQTTEFVPESIRDHRFDSSGALQLFVKWADFPESENSWEPSSILEDIDVREYIKASKDASCFPCPVQEALGCGFFYQTHKLARAGRSSKSVPHPSSDPPGRNQLSAGTRSSSTPLPLVRSVLPVLFVRPQRLSGLGYGGGRW